MTRNLDVWGNRFELAGMLLVVVVALWEAYFTSRWDEQIPQWRGLIQEEVNRAILRGIQDLGDIAATDDLQTRDQISAALTKRMSDAISDPRVSAK